MAFQGIDIRQTGDRLIFRTSLKNSSGDILSTGSTDLRIYEMQNDGSLYSYDWNDNTFKTGVLTTENQAMTHRAGNAGSTNTGLWTYALTNVSGFTDGSLYISQINNAGSFPTEQEREFQFGVSNAFNPFDPITDANIVEVSGESLAADNLRKQYDTTGLVGNNFPATQLQAESISGDLTSLSTNYTAARAGYLDNLNIGEFVASSGQVNALPSATQIRQEIDSNSTQLSSISGDTNELQTDWTNGGRLDVILDELTAQGDYNYDRVVYVSGEFDTLSGNYTAQRAGYLDNLNIGEFVASSGQIESLIIPTESGTANAVWDELLTGSSHNISNSAGKITRENKEAGVYGGHIHIDTINGSAGVNLYENGTFNNPVSNIADAYTLASGVGLSRFTISPGSNLILDRDYSNWLFYSKGHWNLNLNNKTLNDTAIYSAHMSGVCSSSNNPHFENCLIEDVTIPPSHISRCRIENATIYCSGTGDYVFENCVSAVAGESTPTFNFDSSSTVSLNMRNYSGGLFVTNMTGSDLISLEGNGQIVFHSNCTGGSASVRGNFAITDNSAGAVTITDEANYSRTIVNQEMDTALLDYPVASSGQITNLNNLSAAEVNTEMLDVLNTDTLIDGKTFVEALKIVSSVVAGKITDANTATETFLGLDGATTRVTVTVDSSGNRSSVVYS